MTTTRVLAMSAVLALTLGGFLVGWFWGHLRGHACESHRITRAMMFTVAEAPKWLDPRTGSVYVGVPIHGFKLSDEQIEQALVENPKP